MTPPIRPTSSVAAQPITRRAALGAAAGALAAAALPGRRLLASLQADAPGRVVVVGAGFAGLACAYELALRGYAVTILEARERIGGRVLSVPGFAGGGVVEGGATAIGAGDATWRSLAERFGLQLVEQRPFNLELVRVRLAARTLPPAEARPIVEAVSRSIGTVAPLARIIDPYRPWLSPSATKIDRTSVQQWIGDALIEGPSTDAMRAMLTGIFGVPPERQSLLALLCRVAVGGLESFLEGRRRWRCAGGNSQLAERLAAPFRDGRLRLATPVEAIESGADGMSVRTAAGDVLECNDVVLTAPPTAWDRIRFAPGLPPFVRPQMGSLVRYVAARRDPSWPVDSGSPAGLGDGHLSVAFARMDDQTGPDGEAQAIVVGQAGGAAADVLAGAGDEALPRCRAAAAELLPESVGELVTDRVFDWVGDPWSRCGAAFAAPGQVTTVGPFLRNGQGRLHFAGDFCSYAFGGTMEGALSTGMEVARRLAARDGVAEAK